MKNKIAAALWLTTLILAPAVLADDRPPFKLGFRLGFYAPSSSTINQDWMKVRNTEFSTLAQWLSSQNYSIGLDALRTITDNTSYGIEFEYRFHDRTSLVFGAEYVQFTRRGSLQAFSIVDEQSVGVEGAARLRVSALPLMIGIKRSFAIFGVEAYAGAGAGYYLSRLTVDSELEFMGAIIGIPYRESVTGAGGAFVPHATLGFDLPLGYATTLSAEVRLPFGTVNSYSIKKREASTFGEDTGDKMTFTDSLGRTQPFKWELTGVHAGLVLKWAF